MITKKFMKYFITVSLCMVTLIAVLVGCNNTNKTEDVNTIENTEETEETVLPPAGEDSDIHGVTGGEDDNTVLMYTTKDVNVRFLPTTDSEILTTLPARTKVIIYDYNEADEWRKTFLFNEDAYYINAEFLSMEEVEVEEVVFNESTGEPLEGDEEYKMYTTARLNVRNQPGMHGDVITTLGIGAEVTVKTKGSTTNWYLVSAGDVTGYANSSYLSYEKKVTTSSGAELDQTVLNQDIGTWAYKERKTGETKTVSANDFHYYGIYSGPGWKFTPEQIDDAWRYTANGETKYRSTKPHMEPGTTRAWQSYLYQELKNAGLDWYYKIAVAQAMQESGMNPLNAASIDHGLFSFRKTFWNSSYGDIYDYHANIDAYVDRIKRYLSGASSLQDVYMAISQHFNPDGQIHMGYVNSVLSHLEELWEFD